VNGGPEIAPADISATDISAADISAAESRTRHLVDRYAVTIRCITALAAAVFCLLSPRVSSWQAPICVLVLGWGVLRLFQRRRPPTPLLLVLDTVVVCVVGLTQPLTSTPSAVLTQTGFGLNTCNPASLTFAWRPRRGMAAALCALVIVSYLIGASMVDGIGPPWSTPAFYLLPIQAAVSRALLELVIPAARSADRAAAARRSTAVALEVATARRAAEREHWAVLHDTAASTLLMVGEGVPPSADERIRRQARRDLRTLGASGDFSDGTSRLADDLQRVVGDSALRVDLRITGAPQAPETVALATARAVGEALTNVERHSGVDAATVAARTVEGGFEVAISDEGAGFSSKETGRGLSESVIARMERVGGNVDISSTPGHGTVVVLRWRSS
jgi:anti-sigma regulatory factor (Ser/Thr protein kinase)